MTNSRYSLINLFILIISVGFLLVSYIPNYYEASVKNLLPPDRVMVWGEHVYTYDYNVYLSKMRQGQEGRWSVVDKYDNTPKQKGVFLQMLYLLTGKIGGVFHLDPTTTFHVLRTILSLTWVLTIIYLNIYFLKKPVLYTAGIILSLLAASFPVIYPYLGETWVGMHMSWWTEMDVLKRISYLPHYTLNYIIVAFLSVLLYKFSKSQDATHKKQKNPNNQISNVENVLLFENWNLKFVWNLLVGNWNFTLVCFILFFSFFIHPAGGLLFLMSWFLFQFILTVWNRNFHISYLLTLIFYSGVLIVVALIPLLYLKSVTSSYPWKSLVDFDMNNRYGVDIKEYILALGPVFFLGMGGLIISLIKKEKRPLPLVTWVLAAFIGLFVFKKLPFQSELRFVQTANHIPLAILSVYFLYTLYGFFWSRFKKIPLVVIIVNLSIYLTLLSIVVLGSIQAYFSIRSQEDFIHQRAVAGQPLVPYPPQVMYPLKDFWNAIMWLQKNTKNEDVVLSQVNAGNYIPAYAGNFVYIGHNPETPFYNERFAKVEQFFLGTMSGQDALNFLKNEKIAYVFYGPQEREKSEENIKKYSFLTVVFTSSYVTLYKVEK